MSDILKAGFHCQGQSYRDNPARLIPWDNPRVRLILFNPFYCGYVKHQGMISKGTHEPLVDPETWSKIARKVAAGKRMRKMRQT